MRICVVGDSLSMPRVEPDCRVLWHDTWPHLLWKMLLPTVPEVEMVVRSKRARTAHALDPVENVEWVRPAVLILQVGVVDSAPRVFSPCQRRVLASRFVPQPIRERLTGFASTHRAALVAANPLAKVYTPPTVYRSAMEAMRRAAMAAGVRRVAVVPTVVAPALIERVGAYATNADLFNRVLRLVWGPAVLDDGEMEVLRNDESFVPDGIHLSPLGNARLAERLAVRCVEDI